MDLILDLYRGFDIEYDRRHKILTINKPMPVKDFLLLKRLVSMATEEVKDIRLYGERIRRVKKYI